MRFAIYGSGGVGGYYGACLAKAGHEVLFIARGEHLAAMQSRGLVVESIDGDFSLPEVRAAAGPDSGFIADVVIVGVKAWQIKAMADSLSVMMDENSVVLPLQNGVDASRLLAEGVGTERVVGGLCRIFSRITAPGAIHHFAGKTTIGFGELDGQVTERCKRLEQVLKDTPGIEVYFTTSIVAEFWRKVLLFAPLSGVGTVTRTPIGTFRVFPETRTILTNTIREIVALSETENVGLTEADVAWALEAIDAVSPDSTSSMQRDLLAGRPSELHAVLGALVARSEKTGVPAPTLTLLYHSLIPSEALSRGDVDLPRLMVSQEPNGTDF